MTLLDPGFETVSDDHCFYDHEVVSVNDCVVDLVLPSHCLIDDVAVIVLDWVVMHCCVR